MTDSLVFDGSESKLPLLTEKGRSFLGLDYSSSEMNERVRHLFEYLDGLIGFSPGPDGEENQDCFNYLIRYIYPEIMIDLADLIYVQHERPMVYLNFDHIQWVMKNDSEGYSLGQPLSDLFEKMEALFRELAEFLKNNVSLLEDSKIVKLLAESYSFYVHETQNFPWEEPIQDSDSIGDKPVLDVATGLVGFSLINKWPESFPSLYLTDRIPFILESLAHFISLERKTNIEILKIDFPEEVNVQEPLGSIWVNKFLHHLCRNDRQKFLSWAYDALLPMGMLGLVDTDLEKQILEESQNPQFLGRLIPGYLQTLVSIEENFADNLLEDVRNTGFTVNNYDSHEYLDETDAYSLLPGDHIKLRFVGIEIEGRKEREIKKI